MNKNRNAFSGAMYNVSDITLVMPNSQIVQMLMSRGTAIKNKNYKKRDEWNKKITEYVHSLDREKTSNPKQAFITVEQEDCYNELLDGDSKMELFGEYCEMKEATSPTNIKYECRDTTWRHTLITGF